MDRLVGIDYGRKRVGVAASDPLGIFASAMDTVPSAKIIDYLKNYAEKETITRFVVGYPMNLDNTPSEAAADVDAFLKRLAKARISCAERKLPVWMRQSMPASLRKRS